MASSTLPFYVEISRKEEGSTITLLGYDVIVRHGDTSEVVKHFSADGCGMEKASEAAWDFAIMAANARDMMKARDHGMCVARETLRVGEVFKGAAPAGEAAGYARGTGRNAMFMDGFLEVLHQLAPHGIRTDATGTITELVTALSSSFYVANEYGSKMAGGKMFSNLEDAIKAARTALKRRAAAAARSQSGSGYVPELDVIEQRPGYFTIVTTVREG